MVMYRSLLASRSLRVRNLPSVIAKKGTISAKFHASIKSSAERHDKISDADQAKLLSWFTDPSPPEEASALESLPPAESSHVELSSMDEQPLSARAPLESEQLVSGLSSGLVKPDPTKTGLIRKHFVRDSRRMQHDLSMELQRAGTIEEVRRMREKDRDNGASVALVPTMGALHVGHLKLIKEAAQVCDNIYVSIYVNPTQFGPNEDLDTYPRTMDEDMQKLNDLNEELKRMQRGMITCVFTPKTSEMYPLGLSSTSHVIMNPEVTQILEGKARPTFFQGVTTVVMKLLNIVQPECVFFGQKDIQQLVIIQRMVEEFHLNTQVYRCPTERLFSGLAMSSRNVYLGARRRAVARVLFSALREARDSVTAGIPSRDRSQILDSALQVFKLVQERQRTMLPRDRARFELDYLSLADPLTLKEVERVGDRGAIMSGAIVMLPLEDIQPDEELGTDHDANNVRLIDNMLLGNAWNTNAAAVHRPFSTDIRDGPSYAA